jgi:hypothetical protein
MSKKSAGIGLADGSGATTMSGFSTLKAFDSKGAGEFKYMILQSGFLVAVHLDCQG